MPYKWQDMVVLILARLLRIKVARALQMARYVTMLTSSWGRMFRGTSDKSPR